MNKNLLRYPPLFRNGNEKILQEFKIVSIDPGESVTDKESYRLSLTSLKGQVSQLGNVSNTGQFMFEDGKYDSFKDFSYIMRQDLSIVQIDDYIQKLKDEYNENAIQLNLSKEKLDEMVASLEKKKQESQIVDKSSDND